MTMTSHVISSATKRLFDIAFSVSALVIGAIPMSICCLLVSIETKGSPLFLHMRVGKGGKPLGVLKLRSMYVDAEEHIDRYLSPEQMKQWETEHKVTDDPRITRIGHFVRKTSLDEVPQFLNVLSGQMSVVGPRPITHEELAWLGDDVEEFLSVKPGITGYWQAFARNDATWESGERQQMELYYVRNQSLALDARIILKTVSAVFKGTGQ